MIKDGVLLKYLQNTIHELKFFKFIFLKDDHVLIFLYHIIRLSVKFQL